MPHVKRRITTALVASATLATSIGLAAPAYATPQTLTAIYKLITADKHFSGGTAKVEGTAKVGKTLTAKVTGLTPNSNSGATYKYQWLRNGNPIDGAKSKTYKVSFADVGKQLSVQVTATKSGYSKVKITSAKTASVPKQKGTRDNPYNFGETATVEGVDFKPLSVLTEIPKGLARNCGPYGEDYGCDSNSFLGITSEVTSHSAERRDLRLAWMDSGSNKCQINFRVKEDGEGTDGDLSHALGIEPGRTFYGKVYGTYDYFGSPPCGGKQPKYLMIQNESGDQTVFFRVP